MPNNKDNEHADFVDVAGTDSVPVDEHFEEVGEHGNKVRRKGVYLLPNLFTTGALFGGFFALLAAFNGNFAHAAMAIFAAQILDGFDGRVARMTNTQSAFGTEFDSLSDMVSFGLAPAVVLYSWALEPLGNLGVAAAFVFVACAAIRLARFNTHAEVSDSRFFTGLASPPAATLMASAVWWGSETELTTEISILAAAVTAAVGFLMVSNIRYQSFKGLDADRRVPIVALLITIIVFIVVWIDPPRVLFLLAFAYAMSGPLVYLWSIFRGMTKAKSVDENNL